MRHGAVSLAPVDPTRPATPDPAKLGTFGGVFAPSLLTILGLVLFLRLGFVTGNVGLVQMLLIVGLATSVSLLTTISLAAIATNLKVGGGGVYFLISRTLGPAFGGAIGIVLYGAMSVSVAFYSIGLGEAVASVVGSDSAGLPRIIAAVTIVGLIALAWLGADIATRLQYVVMGCLTLAIVAYFVGVIPDLSTDVLSDNLSRPSDGDSFWVAFAIFFPAITGFTQGVAMSGDLRTPSRSITVGTFGAIGVSTVVYLAVVFTFAMAVPLGDLRADTAIMRKLALTPALIDLGVIAATLSSAIASMLGAPRTLQRLAGDRLVKPLQPFSAGAGPADNPRRAAILTGVIALATVAIGDLDVVAPVISMFFLASYGMINYATYSEARAASTSFRPTFRLFDWRLSLLGTLACLGAIIAIDPLAGSLAGAAVFGLYRYLRRSVRQVRWADSTRAFHAAEVRSHLREMTAADTTSREWRPCTVAFAPRDPVRRARLVAMASSFEGGAGFTTIARIVPGRGPVVRRQAAQVDLELRREIDASGVAIYGRVLVAETLHAGVSAMLQAHGIGALRPNLALFSWYDFDDTERENAIDYGIMVQTGVRLGCNVGVLHTPDDGWERVPASRRAPATVSVWWQDDRSGQLLTLLGWMCSRDSVWANAELRVWVADEAGDSARVAQLLDEARIPARVMGNAATGSFVETVESSDLVLAPLRVKHGSTLGPGDVGLDELVPRLPVVAFVHAVADVELDVQPDEGDIAALAEARDRATAAAQRADELDREASALIVAAEMARLDAGNGDGDADAVAEAVAAASRAHRLYIDARARADEARRVVAELDPTASNGPIDPELWLGDQPRPG